ncbi:DUF5343 domain-containing protein [Gillisia sp. M10.2A]|uniref:DUF5343 domain-containing protein n=1 Tax=Gillisia lutea TaxID=2909668 RepID=A0ABS9ECT7_9FLAO|nr:DUF5343 domain-containing protein [Gillisia lutea]MCF4100042.1 DUF5343 domain-containing protein [Gillisia lutea]
MESIPYAQTTGTLESMLEKIKTASVPEKFSQDFVSTVLGMKGGSARSTIPFIKKMGFVSDDGTPTERYREFRNPNASGKAIADAMRELYSSLFSANEYINNASTDELKGIVIQITGLEKNSTPFKKIISTFSALNKLADFDSRSYIPKVDFDEKEKSISIKSEKFVPEVKESINLSYTINLNLPATTDIEVFNAVFKSLKEHLLDN